MDDGVERLLPALPGPVWRAGLDWPARLPTSVVQHGLLGGEFPLADTNPEHGDDHDDHEHAGERGAGVQRGDRGLGGHDGESAGPAGGVCSGPHPHPLRKTNPTAFQETIVTDSSFHLGDQIIYGDELIVTSEDVPQSEEIVGGGPDSDPYVGLYESVPIPNIDSGNKFGVNSFVGSKKQKNSKVKREFDLESLSEGRLKNSASWQQKQVSIKTLEGEFSVTMWASGADDGKCLR